MLKRFCPQGCGWVISMGDDDREAIEKSVDAHVLAQHSSAVAKHTALLADCYQHFANISDGKRVSKLTAKRMSDRITELCPDALQMQAAGGKLAPVEEQPAAAPGTPESRKDAEIAGKELTKKSRRAARSNDGK